MFSMPAHLLTPLPACVLLPRCHRDAALSWFTKHWEQEGGRSVWDNYDWDSNSWGAAVLLNR